MIDCCFNAKCGRELHYLRDGRVVRQAIVTSEAERIEHFWLCGECSAIYKFCWRGDERPTLAEKTLKESPDKRRLEIFNSSN